MKMTTYTNRTVNQAGRVEIKEFLLANHKANRHDCWPDVHELDAWVAEANFSQSEGNPPTIEIPAYNSHTGAAVTYTVSDAGLDSEEIEIDE